MRQVTFKAKWHKWETCQPMQSVACSQCDISKTKFDSTHVTFKAKWHKWATCRLMQSSCSSCPSLSHLLSRNLSPHFSCVLDLIGLRLNVILQAYSFDLLSTQLTAGKGKANSCPVWNSPARQNPFPSISLLSHVSQCNAMNWFVKWSNDHHLCHLHSN